MTIAELTEYAAKNQLQSALAVGHPSQGGVFGFVLKHSRAVVLPFQSTA